jgi:hypothetical protein
MSLPYWYAGKQPFFKALLQICDSGQPHRTCRRARRCSKCSLSIG